MSLPSVLHAQARAQEDLLAGEMRASTLPWAALCFALAAGNVQELTLHELPWPPGERSRDALVEALGRCATRCPALRSVSCGGARAPKLAKLANAFPTSVVRTVEGYANTPRVPGAD